ncbi:MAG: hypothetical protein HUM72_12640 [Dolichospermum sp.]|nr:hypothetical protein [Dolichospermum sp.]
MISVNEYLMGRDKEFPLDMLQARNMAELLSRVNWLFGTLEIHATVSSGYRPSALNNKIGGAKMSTHTVCAGIDLKDTEGFLAAKILDHLDLLEECGLWLENPEVTVGWVHLDLKQRKSRIFNP